ncbi:B-cell receptor CD22-like [Engraulis encrasicolus]|uniref:B-cell receptor CD22-like n=1 Tax=Engraulis encrasicolus TaxID=184585 RepID=UPI002FD3D948
MVLTWPPGSDRDPVDLMEDDRYKGRVNYTSSSNNKHTLTIKPLTLQDAEDYRFRILTNVPTEKVAGPSLSLSVTGLQVQINPPTVNEGSRVTLTCSTTCSLSSNPTYIWYRNTQDVTSKYTATGNTLTIDTIAGEDDGRYSCAVRGHEDHPSPAVCVFKCYGVAYNPESVCALEGSSVELHSYYSYPDDHIVVKTFWFKGRAEENMEPDDLIEDVHYQRRANYTLTTENIHTLRITNLKINDTSDYQFRFITNDPGGKFAGVEVPLSVTGLQVLVDPASVNKGDTVTLTCKTTCSLSSNPTYIWYKNTQPVTNKHTATGNTLTINSIQNEDAGRYSCAVRGHEDRPSPAVYNHTLGIRNLTSDDTGNYRFRFETKEGGGWSGVNVAVSVTGLQVQINPALVNEGSTVTLTCITSCSLSSNPTYIWYKNSQPVTYKYTATGNTLTINSTTTEDAGDYSCAVEEYEKLPSLERTLTVEYAPRNTTVSVSPAGDIKEGDSVNLTCNSDANPPVHAFTWYKRKHHPDWVANGQNVTITAEISTVMYYCTAENTQGSSDSNDTSLDVHYQPKNTSVSVHPSAEVLEGTSVTLTCSSDAHPPVENYTWYKKLESSSSSLWLRVGESYNITSITAEDSGHYYCRAENKYGTSNSSTTHLDVLYFPRNTRVSLSPPDSVKEGDSVTLTCSSDANPPVENYTWYKTAGRVTVIQGTWRVPNINLTLIPGLEGYYHCEAGNRLGKDNSTTVQVQFSKPDPGFDKMIVFAVVGAVCALAVFVLVAIVAWRISMTTSNKTSSSKNNYAQGMSNPVYNNDHNNCEDSTACSNDQSVTARCGVGDNDKDVDAVQYSTVKFIKVRPRSKCH